MTGPARGAVLDSLRPGGRGFSGVLVAGVIVGLAFFFRETAEVFVPFTVSLLLSLAAYPLVEWLGARRVPAWLSVTLVVVVILILLGAAVLLVEQGIDGLVSHWPQFKHRAGELWKGFSSRLGVTGKPLESFEKEPSAIRTIAGVGGSTALSVLGITFQFLLIILYLVLLLLGRRHLESLLGRALGGDRAGEMVRGVRKIERQMLRYLLLRSAVSLVTSTGVGLILYLYGVQFAGLWAMLTFFAQFVPFVGPILLSVLPILQSLLQFPSPSVAGWVALWLVVLHLAIGFIVEPRVFSLGLSLNQTVVLLGLALLGWMWGIIGALLWVPIQIALRLAAQQLPALHALEVFLGPAKATEASSG